MRKGGVVAYIKGSVLARIRDIPLKDNIPDTILEPQSNYFFIYLSRDRTTGFVPVKSGKKKEVYTNKKLIIKYLIFKLEHFSVGGTGRPAAVAGPVAASG